MENKERPRRRARTGEGQFKGDSEAWVDTPVEQALEKSIKYTVKPKVDRTSDPSAGKYSRRKGITPTFGTVHTTTH